MAAEPVPFAALYTITIQPGGIVTTNSNLKITNSDAITFHNGAGFAVNIVFTSVFGPINGLANGLTQSPNGGPGLNTTINYRIYNASTGAMTGGPYAVQIGTGPLIVTVNNLNTSPDPIQVPPGGQIQFVCDAKYNIAWTQNQLPVTAWNPQPLKLYPNANPNPNPVQTALPAFYGESVSYTISAAPETRGGGTVGIGS